VYDFYGGVVVRSWARLKGFVEDVRDQTSRETNWEWFQWLAERILEREAATVPVAAHVAHRPAVQK
jgi:hypothetical protein